MSLYLDLLRFAAAVEVFLYHLLPMVDPAAKPLFSAFGAEAVIVFFVLSGYVISHAAANRDRSAGHYAISRLTRVYCVSVPALLITVMLDYSGCLLDPTFYHRYAPLHGPFLRFGISLLLLNETWVSVLAFSNGPYWSLCYELAYYLIFGAWFYARGRTRIVLVAASLLLAGPRTLLLLPVWIMGSWAFFEHRSQLWRRPLHWALFLLPIPAFWLYWATSMSGATVWIAVHGLGWTNALVDLSHSRQVLSDLYLGGILTLHFLGAKNLAPILDRILRPIARPIRFCARYTFPLYLIHFPLILFLGALLGTSRPWTVPAIVVVVAAATWLLGNATDRQRDRLKCLADRIIATRRGVRAGIAC